MQLNNSSLLTDYYVHNRGAQELNIPELVQEYCNNVSDTSAWFIIIAGLLWAVQPYVFNKLDEHLTVDKNERAEEIKDIIKIVYKYGGIGTLFVVAVILLVVF